MQVIPVLASRSYDILIGQDILPALFTHDGGLSNVSRVCIFTDDNVSSLHLKKLTSLLDEHAVSCETFVFPNGEASKTLATLEKMLEFLASKRFTQSEKILAFGGGVVGDISALAAALYLRGIECIQIPTTLLSAVDSSVGGKCAVDLPSGKNLVGTFYQPSLVLCDTELLKTLPEEEFACGMAEVIKYAVGFSKELFSLCESGVSDKQEEVISACVKIKRGIVTCDEFDRGERKKLNLGHTPAHAIEALSAFHIPHGRAVGMGLSLIAHSFLSAEEAKRIDKLLRQYALSVDVPFSASELSEASLADKKRRADTVSLIVPKTIGACEIVQTPTAELEEIYARGLK